MKRQIDGIPMKSYHNPLKTDFKYFGNIAAYLPGRTTPYSYSPEDSDRNFAPIPTKLTFFQSMFMQCKSWKVGESGPQ